ncbi:MAG: glutaredoxin 3 [Proteobacteria bacterium]|nr:glutaredoxin 3 [Pseudomonadota bacterium]
MKVNKKVVIYGNTSCPFCGAARMLLTKKAIEFEEIIVTDDSGKFEEMQKRSGRRSVPQIFIGETHIGGFDELCALDMDGELDELLAG